MISAYSLSEFMARSCFISMGESCGRNLKLAGCSPRAIEPSVGLHWNLDDISVRGEVHTFQRFAADAEVFFRYSKREVYVYGGKVSPAELNCMVTVKAAWHGEQSFPLMPATKVKRSL
jgi:hypothetical protein